MVAIDTARGTAMLLVCVAHFLLALTYAAPDAFEPGLMLNITAVASPTFMVTSGITFGYLMARSRPDPSRMRARLIDRAAVLLVPVHLLVRLPHLLAGGAAVEAFHVIEITDAIALAMLLNLWLVRIERHTRRLAAALAMFAAAWLLNLAWSPEGALLAGVKDVLVRASWDRGSTLHGFAVLPWAAVHLAATALGERMARAEGPRVSRRIVRVAAGVGIAAMAGGALAKLGHVWWRASFGIDPSSAVNEIVSTLVSPFGKYPPSPVYIAFCGGAGLLFLAAVFAADGRRATARAARQAAVLGRASLCVWIVQAWVYWGAVQHLPVPGARLLPLYFAATVVPIWLAALVWDRRGWNRYLTLGIARLMPRGRVERPRLDDRPSRSGAGTTSWPRPRTG